MLCRAAMCIALGTLLLWPGSAQSETNVIAFLNNSLAAKGIQVKRTRDRVRERTKCSMTGVNGKPHRECYTYEEHYQETYVDQARVKTAELLSIAPITWDKAKITTLPATALIQRLTYFNCLDDPFTTSYTLSVTGSRSNSISKTHSVSLKVGTSLRQSFGVSNGVMGGQTQVTVSLDVTTSDSTTSTEQFSNAETRQWMVSITPKPGNAGYLQLLAVQQSIVIPFSTTLVVDATMEPNISGFSKASQLLTENERTLPFDGSVAATQLSDSYVGGFPPEKKLNCKKPEFKGKQDATVVNLTIPLDDLKAEYAKTFMSMKRAYDGRKEPAADEKHADGIEHQYLSSSSVSTADAECGLDKDGNPKLANHTLELAHFTSWESSILMSEWDELVDTFDRCR